MHFWHVDIIHEDMDPGDIVLMMNGMYPHIAANTTGRGLQPSTTIVWARSPRTSRARNLNADAWEEQIYETVKRTGGSYITLFAPRLLMEREILPNVRTQTVY